MALLAHVGVGFAAKRWAPKISLWVLIIYALSLDLLYILLWCGSKLIEFISKYNFTILWGEWTHSLSMALVWTFLALFITLLIYKNWWTTLILTLIFFSHWIIDFITMPPEPTAPGLALYPFNGSPRIGLGLYSTMLGRYIGEGTIILGIIMYIFTLRGLKKEKNPA